MPGIFFESLQPRLLCAISFASVSRKDIYIIATLPFVYFIGQTIDCSKILSMQERRDPVPVRLGVAGN